MTGKLLLRAMLAVGILVPLFALFAWLGVRASLPQLDGELLVNGLGATASIERDAEGIPTINAQSRQDLAFATGFAHGQDRFFQMDLIRRKAAGELSELMGAITLDLDRRHRFHRFRHRARAVVAAASEHDRSIMASYATGVNAGLDSLGARPFEYFVLRAEPALWRIEDSIIVVYAMFLDLNDERARRDVRRGYAHRVMDPDVYAWLYPEGTSWDAPLMGVARDELPVPDIDTYAIRHEVANAPESEERGKPPVIGSNNWAVGGALTRDGRALVSNDMHLGHDVPNIWYQQRLIIDGVLDVTGVALPGTPFVAAGSNGYVAWGYTNSWGDWSDAVVLTPGATTGTYRTPDGDQSFDLVTELINIKGGDPVPYEIRETVWGPVDDDINYPDGEIAVSWIAHHPNAINLRLIDLETAINVEEALDVANTMALPPQNFVTGDAGGNIAWTIAGILPVRSEFNAMVPADWSREHGWNGWLSPERYPRIVNPDSDRVWTANARVADGDALRLIGDGGYDLGARAQQIRDGLLAKDTFTPEDMLAIQYDDRAIFLARWRDLLLDVLDDDAMANDPQLAEYRHLVEEWLPRAAPESVGYRLVRAFRIEVRTKVAHGLFAPVRDAYEDDVNLLISSQFEAPLWKLVTEKPLHLLPADYASWEELMLAAAGENIRWYLENYGGPLSERSWGERNTSRIRHPLSRALPVLAGWLDMPNTAMSGDDNLPKAQGPGWGASERFSVSPGDEQNGLMHMPAGQSGHPMSEFYRGGHDNWLNGEPSPFLPGDTLHSLTLNPVDTT